VRGHENVLKRLIVHASAFNLGLWMRRLFGIGTPRALQGRLAALGAVFTELWSFMCEVNAPITSYIHQRAGSVRRANSGEALIKALRQGGYVIVMRHASSPREVPNTQTANPDNVKLERQLDEAGRAGSVAMGRALRDLKIPVGEVLTQPDIPRARDRALAAVGESASAD